MLADDVAENRKYIEWVIDISTKNSYSWMVIKYTQIGTIRACKYATVSLTSISPVYNHTNEAHINYSTSAVSFSKSYSLCIFNIFYRRHFGTRTILVIYVVPVSV